MQIFKYIFHKIVKASRKGKLEVRPFSVLQGFYRTDRRQASVFVFQVAPGSPLIGWQGRAGAARRAREHRGRQADP